MDKKLAIVAILCSALLSSMIVVAFAAPPISRPMGFIEETIEGGSPATVDYSIAYDTASGEIIMNMMDNLVIFNGEHTDQFLPAIATNWSSTPLGPGGTGIDSGLPVSGLMFESANQTGPNAKYFYQYDFKIRQGVFFQPPYNYSLTPEDVAFSFQRTMLMDTSGGPQWMLQEPLLDVGADSLDASAGGLADLTNMTQVAEVGALIKNAAQYNATDVWFNLMYPSAYAPFMQILTQTWSSIESKQWINNQVIGTAGRTSEWDGGWPNYTSWLTYRNPTYGNGPLDTPTPMMYGSGPYIITTLDYANNFWSGVRNVNYFRGWPADFPALSGSKPEGYVNTIYATWADQWFTRLADINSGAADFVAVPRQNLADMFKGGNLTNYPLDGIREIAPLPSLAVDAFFFTFDINPATLYGPIGAADAFGSSLIPSDFFGNTNWGINVRKGFAQAFNYAAFIAAAYLGEAIHPATAIIPGLNYYDPTVAGWSYNLAAANASLNLVGPDSNDKMLKDVGFTMTLVANVGTVTHIAPNLLKSAIESLNPLYHVNIVYVSWGTYLHAAVVQKLPMFSIGWLADFPDPHDFALPFYRTGGAFATWQAYSNPAMDALIDQGIATLEGPARAAIYRQIQLLAVADCPSFTLDQAIGRHFERDWVDGWYYNPVYPGEYYYNLNKWYYQAEAQLSTALNPPAVSPTLAGFNLPVDVNYDGKVDMKDIGIVAHAFGTSFGPPQDPRWVFRGDINNDRKIDMKDIGLVAKQFGKTSQTWNPSSVPVMISSGVNVLASPMFSVELNFTNVTAWGFVTADTTLTVPVPLDNVKGPYYDVSVTADFSSNVTVSLAFDGSNMTETQKSNLQMMQYNPAGGVWINITTYVNTTSNVIYGETTHFSLIGIH